MEPLSFSQRIVAGQDGATDDAGVAGGFDVVDHVADEDGFVGVEVVLGEEMEDDLTFIERLGVGLLEVFFHAETCALRLEVLAVDGAEEKGGHGALAEVLEEVERVGQRRDAGLEELEGGVVVVVEFGQGRLGQVLFIELGEGEIEFLAEFVGGERRLAVVLEDFVGGFEDGFEVVDEGAGPVEDDVAEFGHF